METDYRTGMSYVSVFCIASAPGFLPLFGWQK